MKPLHIGMITGWAHGVESLQPLAEQLSTTHAVHCAAVDYWEQDFVGGFLGTFGSILAESDVVLVGWSMGATVTLDVLRSIHLPSVRAVVLLAGTARFTSTDGYPHGWQESHLRAMQHGLKTRPEKTLGEFYRLVAQPAGLSIHIPKDPPSVAALDAGLLYLRDTDLRDDVTGIQTPTLCWHGALDQVIPVGASQYLSDALPNGDLIVHPQAGHDGLKTHTDDVYAAIQSFLNRIL